MKLYDIVKGKITNFSDIAIYVDIVDSERKAICLLSELSRKRLRIIPSYVKVGNVLDFQIIRIDDGYIDLSRKYL